MVDFDCENLTLDEILSEIMILVKKDHRRVSSRFMERNVSPPPRPEPKPELPS